MGIQEKSSERTNKMNSEKLTDNTELEADNTESTEAVNTELADATEGGENAAEAESSASGEENDPFAEVSSLNEWDHSQLIMGDSDGLHEDSRGRIGRRRRSSDTDGDELVLLGVKKKEKKPKKEKSRAAKLAAKIIGRTFVSLFTAIVLAVSSLLIVLYAVANGPSTTMRDQLVLMAMQASATKWVPGLFLESETVDEIVEASHVVRTDVTPIDKFTESTSGLIAGKSEEEIEWIDGIYYTTVSGPTYRAYVMLVKDPTRIYVVTADFSTGAGIRIYQIADREGAVAAINAGEYYDAGGQGVGDNPIGLTYSKGKQVHYDGYYNRTFIGFNKDNKLVVKEGIVPSEAKELEIRDGVCFQTGNVLISNDGESITTYYEDNNIGTAQRTAIGQRADGTVIMVVTDGRSASSIGATHNDIIDIMLEFGAISAGMLDGGSSSMMYYRNYWDILGMDYNSLDEYQKLGIVNKYKAFTTPRKMPTFFLVAPSAN